MATSLELRRMRAAAAAREGAEARIRMQVSRLLPGANRNSANRIVEKAAHAYGGFVAELPLRTAVCGVVNALAYLDKRADLHGRPKENEVALAAAALTLRNDLLDWLRAECPLSNTGNADLSTLREASAEARRFSEWLKRTRDLPADVATAPQHATPTEAAPQDPLQVATALDAPRDQSEKDRSDYHEKLRGCAQSAYNHVGTAQTVWHAGLLLDKLVAPARQKEQQAELRKIVQCTGVAGVVQRVLRQRDRLLDGTGALSLRATSLSPLAAHLARTTPLENAALCLHPLHGFAYLPGSGVKGLARAYAETVWLPAQEDPIAAWGTIERVFGWAPGDEELTTRERPVRKPWIPEGWKRRDPKSSRSGAVRFHDGLPETWPQLRMEIATGHHGAYYRGDGAPRDTESPNLVTFLAAKAGVAFQFALEPEDPLDAAAQTHLDLALRFLAGGLHWLGAGAKTAAGYGAFKVDEADTLKIAELPAPHHGTCGLELVSPAYLAGADKEKEDCDLTVPTLRGQLRWWWRAMHARELDLKTLRRLEAALWGDAEHEGSAIGLQIRASVALNVRRNRYMLSQPKPRGNGFRGVFCGNFADQHGIPAVSTQETQPLVYLHYGVHLVVGNTGVQSPWRYYVEPGATWRLRYTCREATFHGTTIPVEKVEQQLLAAMSLLCTYGGVGTKARRAAGSLQAKDWTSLSYAQCLAAAGDLRNLLGRGTPPEGHAVQSPFLPESPRTFEVATPWRDVWYALDCLGWAYKSFCEAPSGTRHGKHCEEKDVLGLPRMIHWEREEKYERAKKYNIERFASPVHFHIAKSNDGTLVIRMIVVPSGPQSPYQTPQKDPPSIEVCQHNLRHVVGMDPGPDVLWTHACGDVYQALERDVRNALETAVRDTPTPPPLQYDPTTAGRRVEPVEQVYLTGRVVKKLNTRHALIELDTPLEDGEHKVAQLTAKGARTYSVGDAVKVRKIAQNNWEIVGPANP